MKKILLILLFVLPLLAYGYTPLFSLDNESPSKHAMKSPTFASDTSPIASEAAIMLSNSVNEIQNTVASSDIKHESNTVPVAVALPLLAVAIGLFGFGANRRRV